MTRLLLVLSFACLQFALALSVPPPTAVQQKIMSGNFDFSKPDELAEATQILSHPHYYGKLELRNTLGFLREAEDLLALLNKDQTAIVGIKGTRTSWEKKGNFLGGGGTCYDQFVSVQLAYKNGERGAYHFHKYVVSAGACETPVW